jgi:hypothetical protein
MDTDFVGKLPISVLVALVIVLAALVILFGSILANIAKRWAQTIVDSIEKEFIQIKAIVELTNIKTEAIDKTLIEIHDGTYTEKYDAHYNRLLENAKFIRTGNG